MKDYKLGTVDVAGASTPVVLLKGRVYPLRDVLGRDCPSSVFALLQDWDRWSKALREAPDTSGPGPGLDPEKLVYHSPVDAPRKLVCIGINYHDHIKEMNGTAPSMPYSFLRPQTCLAGHREEIRLPTESKMVDWEAELGIIVGRRFRGTDPKAAMASIAGYTVLNDLSARDWIASRSPIVGVDWVIQKGWDQFQPTGPWMTPAEFVSDADNLSIELTLNGQIKQKSNTGQMVFGVQQIMCHLGMVMTLEPGDIIATGTPSGVGFGRKPPEFIQPGDKVSISISQLGTLENTFA
ncbi:MAG: fumarylacetoacetate hydrolase family protein [Xanthobacteraceae bacterium]